MGLPVVGEIEGEGKYAKCFLCEWMMSTASQEQAEFHLAKHLKERHHKKLETVDGIHIPYPWEDET